MSSVAFIGDCFVDREVSVSPSLDSLPKTIVLNWEHAHPVEGQQAASKVSLGIDGRHYHNSFQGKKVVAGLANNHSLDYGEAGLKKSIDVIKSSQWEVCGITCCDDAEEVHILEVDGKRIALLLYAHASSSPVTEVGGRSLIRSYDRKILADDVVSAKARGADYLVAYIHWGAEEVHLPPPDIVMEGRHMVDAGVDLVVGHHAHVVQPVELYKEKYIFYGIGNFYFPDFSTTILNGSAETGFRKIQAKRNRKSIVVILRTTDMTVHIQRATVDLALRTIFLSEARIRPTLVTSFRNYAALFRASFVLGKLRSKLHTVISERRMPKASVLVNLLKLIREKNYR